MVTLALDRLHARYHDVDLDVAARLDSALHGVVAGALDDALASRPMPTAFAVCVPRVTVEVELDPTRPVPALAQAWAAAIVAAVEAGLREAAASVVGQASAQGWVVYRTEVDALADLVRSVGAGDQSRCWAWAQVGLVPRGTASVGPYEVAAALVARVELLPGILRSIAGAVPVPLTADGWIALAGTFARQCGSVRPSPHDAPGLRVGAVATPGLRDDVVGDAVATVPAEVWAIADTAQREDLATLALAIVGPAWSRHPGAAGAVAAAAPARRPRSGREGPHGILPSVSGTLAGQGRPAAGRADRAAGEPDDQSAGVPGTAVDEPATIDAPLVTDWGGAFLLMGILHEVDVASRATEEVPPAELVARVVGAVTGAPLDDPATATVSGWEATIPVVALSGDGDALVRGIGAEVSSRIADQVDDDDPANDLGWIWRRRAEIESSPGLIEATFSLDEVDVRLRRAGLDLDPGYVWWLGRVVRFRYA